MRYECIKLFKAGPFRDHLGKEVEVRDVVGMLHFQRDIELPDGKKFDPKVIPCLYYGRYLEPN